MIDTKEIRAGNWVTKILTPNAGGKAFYEYKVIGEDEYYFTFAKVYFPIALSPDILGKSSFKHEFGDWYKNREAENLAEGLPFLRYKQKTKQWYLFETLLPFQPAYLHQLQNLYYALTKTELVVTLGSWEANIVTHSHQSNAPDRAAFSLAVNARSLQII